MPLRATRLSPDDLDELASALAVASLPIEDLHEPSRTFFRLEDQDGLVGYAGWEGRAPDRLLRSFVIAPSRRGQGFGRSALAFLEQMAAEDGAARFHLLTTTAAPFFRSAGYQAADRSAAPQVIRASSEFSSLCPSSASYMAKDLGKA